METKSQGTKMRSMVTSAAQGMIFLLFLFLVGEEEEAEDCIFFD